MAFVNPASAVIVGAVDSHHLLGLYRADPSFPNLNVVTDRNANTITIDPLSNWGDNWEGYENAVWNPIYSKKDGNWVRDRRCPVDHAIIGVINLPWCKKIDESRACFPVMEAGWAQGFLCQKMPQLPQWNAYSTLSQTSQSGVNPQPGGFVTYAYSCNPEFIGGFDNSADDNTGFVCRSRKDGSGPKFPTHQLTAGCKVTSTQQSFPFSGLFTPLPANTYLVAGDFTAYQQHDYTYTSCRAEVPLGVGAPRDMWKADEIVIAGVGQRYPMDFSIFVLNDARDLQDVRGPVAAGGNVSAKYFSINVGADKPLGLVVGGALDLPTGGTVNGIVYVKGAWNISPYASVNAPKSLIPVGFQAAFSKLREMSTMLSRLPATGNARLDYSTLTLSSADPNFTVFSLSADTLSKTSTIKYALPDTATVVINVIGTAVTMQNIGFQTPSSGYDTRKLKPNRVIWNFPDAKTLFGSSVSIPGSVLAPSADVEIRWGALDGTLVANSVKGFYEYHWAPFQNNLLVP